MICVIVRRYRVETKYLMSRLSHTSPGMTEWRRLVGPGGVLSLEGSKKYGVRTEYLSCFAIPRLRNLPTVRLVHAIRILTGECADRDNNIQS